MRAITFCGIFVLLTIAGNAQQYFFTTFTPKDGLVNNRVSSIFQDHRGRLYFGTYGGLSVYDGAHFINYTTEDGLATSLINDVVEMGDDSLWIVPNMNSLQCLVHGMLKNVITADHFYPVTNQLIRCSDGYYYAISDDGLFCFENNRFVRIPLKDKLGRESGKYLNHAIESHGRLFITSDPYLQNIIPAASLLIYDEHTKKCIMSDGRDSFFCAIETPTKEVLVSTGQGMRKLDTAALEENHIRLLPLPPAYSAAVPSWCRSMYFDCSGDLWASTIFGIVRIDTQGRAQPYTGWNGLPAGAMTCMMEDREHNMWFASEQNGVMELVNREVAIYHRFLPDFVTTDVFAASTSDSVWLYDQYDSKLLLLQKNKQTLFEGEGSAIKGKLLVGKKVYLIGDGGINELQFEGRHFHAVPLYRSATPMNGNCRFDLNGDLVIATDQLTVMAGRTVIQRDLSSLADQAAIDRYNNIWVITRSNELFTFRLDTVNASVTLRLVHHYGNMPPHGSPRSLAVDSAGRVWIGTRDNGLYCIGFDHDSTVLLHEITRQNGLSEDFISFLLCDAHNTLWACTPTGLDRIDVREGRISVENVTPCHEHYEAMYKIVASAAGIHWAIAKEGIVRIGVDDRSGIHYNPGILFSKVSVADQPAPDITDGRLSLPYDRNTLSFYVGVPTFVNEGQTRYSYLLEGGQERQWSTPSTRADINLVNLPPGEYTLRVKAEFLTGRYPATQAAYPFVIRPPWWQTWEFRLITVLAAVLLIWFGIRYYLRSRLEIQRTRLEREQAVEKERTRIATDMHDDLGAGLSRIKFLSETIHLKRQMGQPVVEDVGSIGRYANEMIAKMGEIVWALNQKNDSLSDLLSYTRAYAVEYLLQAGISCSVDMKAGASINRFVSGEFRRNVYLTIKEALHNIVKHSRAEHVWLGIATEKDLLTITIADDGVGFDAAEARPAGNGLSNMRQRIRAIGGQLEIASRGKTVILLKVPLP